MALPVALYQKIVDFLTSLPNINDSNGQQAFINSVVLDVQLHRQITFPGSPTQFIELLVPQLERYGQLEDGRNALEAALESAKNYVGQDRRECCERLLQKLGAVSNVNNIPEDDIMRVKKDYDKALSYQDDDPTACLATARRIAEDICTQLVRLKTSFDPHGLMLHKLIGKLTAENTIPSFIVAPLRTIQNYGNIGAHPQGKDAKQITSEYVQPCMQSLKAVLTWYLQTYGNIEITDTDMQQIEPIQSKSNSQQEKEFSPTETHLKIFEKTPDGLQPRLITNSPYVTIGRSVKSDIQLEDKTVSTEHGSILFTEYEYVYRHVSKTNPTYIKRHHEEILLQQNVKIELPLKNNDRIVIGEHILIVQCNVCAASEVYTTTQKHLSENERHL